MEVFLVRHADAVDETLALRDPHRHLTPVGRTKARALGTKLAAMAIRPTHVWSSPLVRAVQTAELVAGDFAVEVVAALAPDGSQQDVAKAIAALPADACVILVGHEPSLSGIGGLVAKQPDFAVIDKACAVRIGPAGIDRISG